MTVRARDRAVGVAVVVGLAGVVVGIALGAGPQDLPTVDTSADAPRVTITRTVRTQAPTPPKPAHNVEEHVHDFGQVIAGEPVEHTFTLTNRSDRPLVIENVRTTCGCTVTDEWAKQVPPGGTWTLPVTLKTDRIDGDTRKTIKVTTTDRKEIHLVLAGRAVQRFTYSPRRVFLFRPVNKLERKTLTLTITNELDPPVTLKNVRVDNDRFTAKLREVEKGKRYEVEVTTVLPLAEKVNVGKVTVETDLADQPELQLRAYAFVRPQVQQVVKTTGSRTFKAASPATNGVLTTYEQHVTYGLPLDHNWHIPVMGALEGPVTWGTNLGNLFNYDGKYMFNSIPSILDAFGYAVYDAPYPPQAPVSGVRLIEYNSPGCDPANINPDTPEPPSFADAKATANAWCESQCGSGFAMTDFDMNQWQYACYGIVIPPFTFKSYRMVTWGGTRCEKILDNGLVQACNPLTGLTEVRSHLGDDAASYPQYDLDGDGVISLRDLTLARNEAFGPYQQGLGETFPAIYKTNTTIDQSLALTQFVVPGNQRIASYMEITHWDTDPLNPIDCNDPASHIIPLEELSTSDPGGPSRIGQDLADLWCQATSGPTSRCAQDSLGYTIGHCRILPDGTHVIRITGPYCMKCE